MLRHPEVVQRHGEQQRIGDKVIAHFANRTSFEAPALIGADGGASAVRGAVFGGQNASYTGHVALRALVPITRVPEAIAADPYALYVGAGRSLIHWARSIMARPLPVPAAGRPP